MRADTYQVNTRVLNLNWTTPISMMEIDTVRRDLYIASPSFGVARVSINLMQVEGQWIPGPNLRVVAMALTLPGNDGEGFLYAFLMNDTDSTALAIKLLLPSLSIAGTIQLPTIYSSPNSTDRAVAVVNTQLGKAFFSVRDQIAQV